MQPGSPQNYPPASGKSSSGKILIGILAGALAVALLVILLLARGGKETADKTTGATATPTSASTVISTAEPTSSPTLTGNEEVVPEANSSSDVVIEDVKIDANGTVTVTGNTATANLNTGDIEVTTVYNDGTVVNLPIDVTTVGSQFNFSWSRPKSLPSPGQQPGEWRNYQLQIRNKAGGSSPATIGFQPRSGAGPVGGGGGSVGDGGGGGGPAGGGGGGPAGGGRR